MKIPSITQLRDGPPSVDLMTAAAVLGMGRTKAYELARTDRFPVKVIRIGTSYRVPVIGLLRLLSIGDQPTAPRPMHPERRP